MTKYDQTTRFYLSPQTNPTASAVYANDNEQFKRLTHIITESRFNGVNAKETTGTFYIQGKVLLCFDMSFRLDIVRAFGAVKYSPENSK